MNSLAGVLPYIQVVISVLLTTAILLQRSSAGLGGAFGDSSNFSSIFHARRGSEKVLFIATIVLSILFGLTAIIAVIIR